MSATSTAQALGIGVSVLLLALSALSIIMTGQVSDNVARSALTVELSDRFQDVRYGAVEEHALFNTYLNTRRPADRQAREQAAARVTSTLTRLAGRGRADTLPGDADRLADMSVQQARYEALCRQVIAFLDAGSNGAATVMATAQIEPRHATLLAALSALEEQHHSQAVAALQHATGDANRLRTAAPYVMTLTLVLVAGLAWIRRSQLQRARHQSLHDALTGLPNRLLFTDRVTQAVAAGRRNAGRPVVLMLNLDRFKEVNDTLGHHCGDQLLTQVAERLVGVVRLADSVACLGGDEFGVLLPDGGPEAGTMVAERIIAALDEPFTLDGVTVGIEASVGIATFPDDLPTTEVDSPTQLAAELLGQADSAMYQAKTERTGYVHFAGGGNRRALSSLALLGELRRALDHDELVLHFQPQVASDTGALLGVEALVRWQHPTRGLLPPGEFIALAEGTTLIHRLTTTVVDKSLLLVRHWLDRGVRLPVAVNVSARSLLDENFPAGIRDQLAAAGLPGDLLCLELTEGAVMLHPDRALIALRELKAMGVHLSLDDFGTGYSSMAYLKLLPVDELKVDQSFVRELAGNAGDVVLVQSAIDLGHNLGLSVVAEGVEDAATVSVLVGLGADVLQGYYVGRPMPADRLAQWMSERYAQATRTHAADATG